MSNNGSCVLYVFIDESGNLDFGPKGTKNFVLAAVITKRPLVSSLNMQISFILERLWLTQKLTLLHSTPIWVLSY